MKNSDLQRQYYEGAIDSKEIERIRAFKESDRIRINKLNIFLEDISGKRVLNIGCGSGGFVNEEFLKRNTVFGLDIALSDLERAKGRCYIPLQADLDSGIPIRDGVVDIVIASEVIEHIVDTDFLLSETNRVLKTGGMLFLTTPNINTLLSYVMMIFLDMPPYRSARYKSPHVRDFTKRTLQLALESSGFEIRKYRGTALFLPYMGYFMSSLCDVFPRFGSELLVQAVKRENIDYRESNFSLLLQ